MTCSSFPPQQSKHTFRAQGNPGRKNTSRQSPLSSVQEARLLDFLARDSARDNSALSEITSLAALGSSSQAAAMLDAWLNTRSEATTLSDESYWPKAYGDDASSQSASQSLGLNRRQELDRTSDLLSHLRKRSTASARESGNGRVQVSQGRYGHRIETFSNGAMLVKDDRGRVVEVVSERGVTINLSYDAKGHLNEFHRIDLSGGTHSRAECDGNSVLVRDRGGRVKAQGESMQVDPLGCISIAREDGQFWSLDLVRSVHIERRLLPDAEGNWHSMTALFTWDGFRMATRFRKINVKGDSVYRFYGRDGSMIEFGTDEALSNLKPSVVTGPGLRYVAESHRNKRQAGSAWEALREYRANYLSTI